MPRDYTNLVRGENATLFSEDGERLIDFGLLELGVL